MFLSAIHTVHSTGVNWGQALATWIPICLTVIGALAASIRYFSKRQKEKNTELTTKIEQVAEGVMQSFANTLSQRFDKVENHLVEQDKRLSRIDRNTGTDST